MLRIGLTGGIGAGKSTVSGTFNECGGVIVDGDVIAREVVEPGTEGLAALVDVFGSEILLPDGALNRPALAARVFQDDAKRAVLNGIVHPLVGRRRAEIIAAVPDDAVVVEDIPLLVETGMAPLFPLVVVVYADIETRLARLMQSRGMPEADARARIAAQASEEQRRANADVLLDNSGSQGDLVKRARELWYQRILPFAHNVRARQIVSTETPLVPADPTWPDQARRIVARIAAACGAKAVRVDHIGSTAVPGLDANDVIDIQVTVPSLAIGDEIADALAGVGYPRRGDITRDPAKPGARSTVPKFNFRNDVALWQKRLHAAADPGRLANVHIRVEGWPNQQFALLFVDWLTANPGVRADYLAVQQEAEEQRFLDAYPRAWDWADAVDWRP